MSLRQDYGRLAEYRQRRSLVFLLELLLFDNGFQAVVLHRLAHGLKRLGLPFLAPAIARTSLFLTGVDINPRARLGPGLVISHGVGLVIGADVVAGNNLLLHHQVTLGAPTVGRIDRCPRIGDDVVLGAGAKVFGGVEVGSGSFVGAGVVLTESVPPGSKVTLRDSLVVTAGS
ncbi:MAG: DapH/DapD/GlmU-related protein [Acidobacteriota bacterium]